MAFRDWEDLAVAAIEAMKKQQEQEKTPHPK